MDEMKLPPNVREFFQNQGRIGGLKRKENLTAAERKEIARKAVNARWAKAKRVSKEKQHG
jgi:hypothetical protein